MGERSDNLAEKVDAELIGLGYRKESNLSDAAMSRIDAVYRHKDGRVLYVERKSPHLYRAEEFRGLIGDAILRFEKARLPRKARLMLAIILDRMSQKAKEDLRDYAARFLPDLQWILLAGDGRGHIHIEERDEDIQEEHPLRSREQMPVSSNMIGLFSPKSQWLWKLLLMPGIDRRYWGGPQQKPGSISELADVSGISQPAVSSFVSRAEDAGFVKRIAHGFVVERHRELLEGWGYALKHGRRAELPLRFLYPGDSEVQLLKRLRLFCKESGKGASAPPLVVGYHLACHLAGIGRSNIRAPWLYAKGNPDAIMAALALARADAESAQLSIVVPSSPESVYGGFVRIDGLPVCDVLQCYLDVRMSHARGMEQAEFIMERILRPHFEGRK